MAVLAEEQYVHSNSKDMHRGKRASLIMNEKPLGRKSQDVLMLEDQMENLVRLPISKELKSSRSKASTSRTPTHLLPTQKPAESLGYAIPGPAAYSPTLSRNSSSSSIPRLAARRPSDEILFSSVHNDEVSYLPPENVSETLASPVQKASKIPRSSNSSSTSSHTHNSLYRSTSNSSLHDLQSTSMLPPPLRKSTSSHSQRDNEPRQTDDVFFPSVEQSAPKSPTPRQSSEGKRKPLSTAQANKKARRPSRDLDSQVGSASPNGVKRTPSKSTAFPPQRKASLSRSTPASGTNPHTPRSEVRARAVTGNLTSRKRPSASKPLPSTPSTSSASKDRRRSVSTSLLSDMDSTPIKPPWERNTSPLLYRSEREAALAQEAEGLEYALPRSTSRTWDDVIIPTVAKQLQQKKLDELPPDDLVEEWTTDGKIVRSVTLPSLLSSRSLVQESQPQEVKEGTPPTQSLATMVDEGPSASGQDIEMQERKRLDSVRKPPPGHLDLPARTEPWQQPDLASPRIAKRTMEQRQLGIDQKSGLKSDIARQEEKGSGCRCTIS